MQLTTRHTVINMRKMVSLRKVSEKGQHGSTVSNKKTSSEFVQLLAKIAKLEKDNEKLKKSSGKPKHTGDYGSDSDSNSS